MRLHGHRRVLDLNSDRSLLWTGARAGRNENRNDQPPPNLKTLFLPPSPNLTHAHREKRLNQTEPTPALSEAVSAGPPPPGLGEGLGVRAAPALAATPPHPYPD